MGKGLTYFRLVSPYEGDITKNCALDGYEVDSNFFTLEGRDIKSVNVNGNELIITLINGETISSLNAFADFTKDITFDFDTQNGILYIKRNGITQTITGFATSYNTGEAVAADGTIIGNGKPSNPIGISPLHKTGFYRPVKSVIDMTRCETLPTRDNVTPGDRFVTIENISEYGYLYNYDGVKQIACDLVASNSKWRIPTKEDWDDMLNAIEPCDSDKDHASATANKYFGKFAGKFLKSKDLWRVENCITDDNTCNCNNNTTCTINNNVCVPTNCCDAENVNYSCVRPNNSGIDKYGFRVTPAGYTDDGGQFGYFLERAWFWTASNKQYSNVYTKRFEYNKSTVYQDIISTKYNLSLRLIKDYDGDNFIERENILGMPYSTVLMPSQKRGKAIWTSTNVAFPNKVYNPVLPNDGMGCMLTKKYFINEWDGKRWIKNLMSEGESVVINNAPNGGTNVEYRIVRGDLLSISNSVYEEVMTTVSPVIDNIQEQINNETKRAIAKENDIVTSLTNEITRATEKENSLEELINQEINNNTERFNDVNQKIDTINSDINNINTSLDEFKNDTEQKINEINTSISNETTSRSEADEELLQKINEEAATRETKDNEILEKIENDEGFSSELSKRIDAEIESRQQADEVLKSEIDAANDKISDVETKLNNYINDNDATVEQIKDDLQTETQNRINGDSELDNKIQTVDGEVITQNGSSFDSSTGILTLKSKNETNDIQIQFSLNFGDI